MENVEISGSVTVTEDGKCFIDSMVDHTDIRMCVIPYEDHYTIQFDNPRMTSLIKVSDVIEARVEIACVLREAYGFDEDLVDMCKLCIEDCWREPIESCMCISNKIAEYQGDSYE